MKHVRLALTLAALGTFTLSNAFAKGDATSKKLLSDCKGAIKEYCDDVKNKKSAKEVFDCLEKHEDSLKKEAELKKCAAAHEAYETAHGSQEPGEEHYK
ncbi:MAG: hypothetical protein ACXVB9_18345 [Bdellovibrionota bacterium]